jgi:hypothetical protein
MSDEIVEGKVEIVRLGAIEANDTEISIMQDVINRSAPIAVEADYETQNYLVNA